MSIKSNELPKNIRLHDYLNNPKDTKKVIKEIPTLDDKPAFLSFEIWVAIINVIQKVYNLEIDKDSESELVQQVQHRTYIITLLEKVINEYISKSGVIDRHAKLAKKGKPCKCATCTGSEVTELERNIKSASQIKYLLEFTLLEYLAPSEKNSGRKTRQKAQPDDYTDSSFGDGSSDYQNY